MAQRAGCPIRMDMVRGSRLNFAGSNLGRWPMARAAGSIALRREMPPRVAGLALVIGLSAAAVIWVRG